MLRRAGELKREECRKLKDYMVSQESCRSDTPDGPDRKCSGCTDETKTVAEVCEVIRRTLSLPLPEWSVFWFDNIITNRELYITVPAAGTLQSSSMLFKVSHSSLLLLTTSLPALWIITVFRDLVPVFHYSLRLVDNILYLITSSEGLFRSHIFMTHIQPFFKESRNVNLT